MVELVEPSVCRGLARAGERDRFSQSVVSAGVVEHLAVIDSAILGSAWRRFPGRGLTRGRSVGRPGLGSIRGRRRFVQLAGDLA